MYNQFIYAIFHAVPVSVIALYTLLFCIHMQHNEICHFDSLIRLVFHIIFYRIV